ncbi:pyridoxal 5'-phosphate synthase glutaminase subunit PdxT [Arthrobacter sp. H14-L1]|nr:pyridoxal 5'-phosphate synthase glutaminase subunit PdxT [Arthrobacter sp. H14-L1]MCY0903802.1 pyridoxal 5'-phosphate synthase glutaminase subunit PdxT [Arthrobacter sp. H14-L1]
MTIERPVHRPLTVGILALQGDVREHARAIEACGARAVSVRRATELADVDALILPGGESTTIDKLTRIFSLAEPLKERISAGMPVYGSCAGMILLADEIADPARDRDGNAQQTLGGLDITVRRNAFGRQRESFETDLDFAALNDAVLNDAVLTSAVLAKVSPTDAALANRTAGAWAPNHPRSGVPVHAVFIRAPWVERVGASVQVLASVQLPAAALAPEEGSGQPENTRTARIEGNTRAVAVRSRHLLATSFHPEVTGERRIHELFIRMIRGEA